MMDCQAVGANPKRVLLVIRLLAARRGGAERVFAELADSLSTAGHEVIGAHCDSSSAAPAYAMPRVQLVNLYRPVKTRSKVERLLGFMARRYPGVSWLSPIAWLAHNSSFVFGLRRLMLELRPDVVISFLPPANTPTLLAGALARARVVVTNHGEPDADYRSRSRWSQNPVDRWLRYKSLGLAAKIQVLSEEHASWLPKQLRDRTSVIPNGLAAEFEELAEEPRREPCIVAVGRLVPEKGHAMLIEAFGRLANEFPDWSVRIYGDGPERERLRHQIRSAGLVERVHLLGQTDQIRAAYLAAKILCHSAPSEGFGLAMLEALACGLPVVALSECRAARDLVRHEENGLLVARSDGPAALAAALARLMSDELFRRKLGAAAPAGAANFNRQAFATRWSTLVDSLIEERTRARGPARLVA